MNLTIGDIGTIIGIFAVLNGGGLFVIRALIARDTTNLRDDVTGLKTQMGSISVEQSAQIESLGKKHDDQEYKISAQVQRLHERIDASEEKAANNMLHISEHYTRKQEIREIREEFTRRTDKLEDLIKNLDSKIERLIAKFFNSE